MTETESESAALRDARIAELERERDRAIQQHERCAEKLFNAERQRDMLSEAAKAALHYMRLHKYADQAWADDLEAAIAAAMTPNAQVTGLSVSEGEETMERDLRAEGWGPEDCYPETAEVSKSDTHD